MAIVTLASIIAKIRRITGADATQIPDYPISGNSLSVGITDYINSFYNYDFPAQFRSLKLKDVYAFNTIQNQDTYQFNSEQYTTVEAPCYCMKREIKLFNDKWGFYGANFNWQEQTNFTYGNGTIGPYSGYTTAYPVLMSVNNNPYTGTTSSPYTPGSTNYGTPNTPGVSQGSESYAAARVQNILITANTASGTLNVTDDGAGNLIGDLSTANTQGTINYQTGQISNLYFSQTIPSGNNIQIQYNPFEPTIPLAILYFQNQFILRPIPDQGYTIEITAYRQPSQALASYNTSTNAGTPELSEWWETIAFGAAKKIFQDRLDTDGVALMDKFLKDAYDLNYTRTYAQLGKQRVKTIYEDQLTNNYGSSGFGSGTGATN